MTMGAPAEQDCKLHDKRCWAREDKPEKDSENTNGQASSEGGGGEHLFVLSTRDAIRGWGRREEEISSSSAVSRLGEHSRYLE